MVWLKSTSKCSKANDPRKEEDMMSDCDEDLPYLHVKHVTPRSDDTSVGRRGHITRLKARDARDREGNCSCSSVTCNCVGVALLLLSIGINVILTCCMCAVINWDNGVFDVSVDITDMNTSVCVLCASIGIVDDNEGKYILDDIKTVKVNNSQLCCLKNSEHLQKLVTLFSAQYASYDSPGNGKDGSEFPYQDRSRYGAHLYVDSIALKENKLVWTDEYGLGAAYIGTGVEMVNGSYKITQDGCYYVYSFVTFKSRESSNESQNAVHTVSRYSPKLPQLRNQLLLIRKQSLARESETFRTSYLGASLRLRQGDELFVNVNQISAVYAFAPSNYFGLIRLQ